MPRGSYGECGCTSALDAQVSSEGPIFFILSRMGQGDTNIIRENIFYYKIQFSRLLFTGLFQQKFCDKVYRVTRNVVLGARPLFISQITAFVE